MPSCRGGCRSFLARDRAGVDAYIVRRTAFLSKTSEFPSAARPPCTACASAQNVTSTPTWLVTSVPTLTACLPQSHHVVRITSVNRAGIPGAA